MITNYAEKMERDFYYWYQKCYEKSLEIKEQQEYVFMFHQVCDRIDDCFDKRYSISFESFKIFIYEILKVFEVGETKDLFLDNSKRVVITFDDAFVEVYTKVFPFLTKIGIPFIVFQTVNYINSKGYLTDEMLRELVKSDLCTIGTHSVSHSRLRRLNVSDVKKEIELPREILHKYLGNHPTIMAYPYGSLYAIGKREKVIAAKCYEYAYSTICGGVSSNSDRYFIPRININEDNYLDWIERINRG